MADHGQEDARDAHMVAWLAQSGLFPPAQDCQGARDISHWHLMTTET